MNLIENQPDIDEIYLYEKDPYEAKYQYLINIGKKVGLKRFNDPKAFIEYLCVVYKNIDKYNIDRERKILIVFDDIVADIIKNKKLNSIVTELFIKGRKLDISQYFQSYFKVPKDARLYTTNIFISKIQNRRKLQQTAINRSSDISSKDFENIYKKMYC